MEPDQPFITSSVKAVEQKASALTSQIPGFWKKKFSSVGIIILVVFLWIWLSSPMVVSVTGNGEVSSPATNATISFTLMMSDSGTPQSAISGINTKAQTMRTFLKNNGIAEEDIVESQVAAVPAALVTAGETGYQATISMAVKTANVSDISTLISDLYSQGAYVVSQPILSIENQKDLDEQAFRAAMKDANIQANRIGLSRLKFIRKVVSIAPSPPETTSTATSKADVPIGDDSVISSDGVFKTVQSVFVTYKMW